MESIAGRLTEELMELEKEPLVRLSKEEPKVKEIKPSHGFCVKIKGQKNEKVFINICHCQEIPKPHDVSEEQLLQILESDATSFRIPMSIGEPHKEKDKSGKDCIAYDIVVNTEYFERVKNNTVFSTFLVTVCCEGIQDKYNTSLVNDSWVMLKNKSYHGTMPKHYIHEKPLIAEISSEYFKNEHAAVASKDHPTESVPLMFRKNSEAVEFVLRQKPAFGYPEVLFLEIYLPDKVTNDTLSVSVGEDRVIVCDRENKHNLDLSLPYAVVQERCSSEFYICKKVLLVTFPVQAYATEIKEFP